MSIPDAPWIGDSGDYTGYCFECDELFDWDELIEVREGVYMCRDCYEKLYGDIEEEED